MNSLRIICCIFLFALLWQACDAPISLSIGEAKRKSIKSYPELRDTSQLTATQVTQTDKENWLFVYNNAQAASSIHVFRVNSPQKESHIISLKHKPSALVEKLFFQDVTHDGELELVIQLHYDYGLSYQGRELIIIQEPFDSLHHKEIFDFNLYQVWESIDSFDQTFGVPSHSKRIENDVHYEFFEGDIFLKGTIKNRKHHVMQYRWDKAMQHFSLVLDEDLHEEDEENKHGLVTPKLKGTKRLLEINAHERNCKAFVVEDAAGHVFRLPQNIHDALLCSRVTSLSDDGRFLIYTDLRLNKLLLYNFEKNKHTILVDKLETIEGVSDIIWYRGGGKYYFAYVIVNPDELAQDTQIHVWNLEEKTEKWTSKIFERKVFYECDFSAYCTPQKEYDFRFSNVGNILYRVSKTGHTMDDFLVLKLSER